MNEMTQANATAQTARGCLNGLAAVPCDALICGLSEELVSMRVVTRGERQVFAEQVAGDGHALLGRVEPMLQPHPHAEGRCPR
jgi:hypothetical protein